MFNVGRRMFSIVVGDRLMPILALYPTDAPMSTNYNTNWLTYQAANQAALKSGGWPLVVFSHGWWECGNSSMLLLWSLAAAGAIVVAPDHPNTGNCKQVYPFHGPWPPDSINQPLSNIYSPELQDDLRLTIDFGLTQFGDRQVMSVGHSVGGWSVCFNADTRVTATLLISPAAANQIASEYAQARGPKVIVYGATEPLVSTPLETFVFDAVAAPAYQTVIGGANHYTVCDRTECRNALSIQACLAAHAKPKQIVDVAIAWLRAFGPTADSTSLATLRAFDRVKE